jgi:hypothetical protein
VLLAFWIWSATQERGERFVTFVLVSYRSRWRGLLGRS